MELNQRIEKTIESIMAGDGYGVVRVLVTGNIRKTLQIMIERLDDEPVGIVDCENVSRLISPLLDVENFISESYALEISSPGIDRPLVKPKDFIKFVGNPVAVQTNFAINNRKKFQGTLDSASETGIRIMLQHLNDDGTNYVELSYDDIRTARLNIDF
jgi:ribosome maturation factor RimP